MNPAEAHNWLIQNSNIEPGRYFTSITSDYIGAGMLARDIRFPLFDEHTDKYLTVESFAYLLSHECDIHEENIRPFSDYLLVCPILNFEDWVVEYKSKFSGEMLENFLAQLAKRKVYRSIYIPCYDVYRYGGLLYFNLISHTHKSTFGCNADKILARTTPYSLRIIDSMLQNHFFREIAQ